MRKTSHCPNPPAGVVAGVSRGFTLIELLVVIAIAAVLMAIAAPSFRATMNSMRLSSTSSQLLSDLNNARNEAIKRNTRVLACVRNSAGTACGTGTNWATGWLICYDNETNSTPGNGVADGVCDVAPLDGSRPNPILVRTPLHESLTLTATATSMRFNPNGTQGPNAGATPVTLTLGLNPSTGVTRTTTVAVSGNISK